MKEPQIRADVPGSGDDYLERAGGKPARLAFCLPPRGLDDQAGIVAAQGGGTDQNRVALGTHLVHSVEVLFVGQTQTLRGGVIDVAVNRHRAAHDLDPCSLPGWVNTRAGAVQIFEEQPSSQVGPRAGESPK